MKATGIVRRIDDLGRIVIPKEIRRTLRIRETDPMEIYTDMDGQIVLKKYSPMADVSEFAVEYAESIAQNTGMTIAITDRDCVIAAAGTQKKNVQGKHITKELNDIMDKRQSVVASASENDYVKAVTDYDCESEVISPIIIYFLFRLTRKQSPVCLVREKALLWGVKPFLRIMNRPLSSNR